MADAFGSNAQGLFAGCRLGGAGGEVHGDYGNVVGLAEALGGLCNVAGGLVADLLGSLEAEEFPLRIGGFHYSIG